MWNIKINLKKKVFDFEHLVSENVHFWKIV